MKFFKKSLAVVLALMMLSSTFVCFAAELNQDAVDAHMGQYKNYVLLGDSAASGYRDEMSDNDYAFNAANKHSTYYRVEGGYADIIAKAIVEPAGGTMTALAAPGFRTIEMRYMLEDEYAANCTDEYLFWPSQLYAYDDEYCVECGEFKLPGSEHFRKEFKKSIAEADLITIGIGGNDWGAYLTWVINALLKSENVADKYIAEAQEILEKSTMDMDTVAKLVEVAHLAGALRPLLETLPEALNYGLYNFYTNWDIMIQDIYDLNEEVTLMVVGMSDNSVKGKYYDYNGVVGESVIPEGQEEDATKAAVMKTIVDFIMSVGNKPMIDGVEKFGYTYVDTDGTTYVDSHYDAAGHVFVANKIIEALPSKDFYKKFEDVTTGNKYYKAIEYVVSNGIMQGKTETTFAPDELLTQGELSKAVAAITGVAAVNDSDASVSELTFAVTMFSASAKKGFISWVKSLMLTLKIIFSRIGKDVTRGQAAQYIYEYSKF